MRTTKWGPWEYREGDGYTVLVCTGPKGMDYEVDLDRCTTSAETLDWIFQVAGKAWADEEIVANLIFALEQLLRPQASLCSGGDEQGPIKDGNVRELIHRIQAFDEAVEKIADEMTFKPKK